MELTPETQEQFDRLAKNFDRIDSLEAQIKSLAEAGEGTAELKEQVAQVSLDNAKALDAAKAATEKALNDRIDEVEARYQKSAGFGARAKSAGAQFVESDAFKAAPDRTRMGEGVVVDIARSRKDVTTSGNQNPPNYTGELVRPQDERFAIRDLIPGGRSARDVINYVKMTGRATNAAAVAAGALKPESNLVFADATASMVKLAHFIPVTEEQLSDIDGLRSLIDAELRYGILDVEDQKFLNGAGGAGDIEGIVPQATVYDEATYADKDDAGVTLLDEIRGMIAQLQVARYSPDGIVMHPADWFAIETTKTTDGAYVFANPQGVTAPRLWGLPVVATTQIPTADILVGAFGIGAQIFDGQLQGQYGVQLKTGQPNDYFLRNQYAVLAEERVALAVKRPDAFVYNDADAV